MNKESLSAGSKEGRSSSTFHRRAEEQHFSAMMRHRLHAANGRPLQLLMMMLPLLLLPVMVVMQQQQVSAAEIDEDESNIPLLINQQSRLSSKRSAISLIDPIGSGKKKRDYFDPIAYGKKRDYFDPIAYGKKKRDYFDPIAYGKKKRDYFDPIAYGKKKRDYFDPIAYGKKKRDL